MDLGLMEVEETSFLYSTDRFEDSFLHSTSPCQNKFIKSYLSKPQN